MNSAAMVREIQLGHRQPSTPEIVRLIQRGSERIAVAVNTWQGVPPSDLSIAEMQNAATGLQSLLRQLRSAVDAGNGRK